MFSRFFIYRPIFAAVVSIVIVILGAVALVALPVARYPEIAPPTIVVTATYPGASPETIAETVATPIEQEVNGVEGMLYMTSTSSADGTMTLKVTFSTETDLDMANVLVQNRVSLAESKLPEEVRRLGVSVMKRSSEITLLVTLWSEDDRYDESFLNNYAAAQVRDELTRVEGVGDVTIFGVEMAMRIWLDPEKMRVRGLSPADVVAAIQAQNVEVAAGKIGEPPAPADQPFQFTVSTQGRLATPEAFADIIIKQDEDGGLLRIRDVGRVELGSQDYLLASRYNGKPTSTLAVYQLPGANAIEVADNVAARMADLATRFPAELQFSVPFDATLVIRASMREVVITLFITLALVVFTVYLFLQDLRATLIPAVTIPVSLVGTFIVMAGLGYTLNILTLFGLVLVIGIVVDDAIVVVENTSRLIAEGKPRKEAAVQSMTEVSGPVVATTLVLLAVFVPTIFLGGIVGRLFQQFAVTISVATVFSSINALTLSPALCGLLLRPPGKPAAPFRAFNALLGTSNRAYAGIVRIAIKLAPVGLAVFAAMVALAIFGLTRLPTGFVPQEDEGYFVVNVQLPDAASVQRTEAVLAHIDEILMDTPGVKDVVSIRSYNLIDESRASNTGSIFVILAPWEERNAPELRMEAIVASLNARFSQFQEAFLVAFSPPSLPGLGMASGFTLQLQDRAGAGLGMLQNVAAEMIQDGNSQEAIAGMFTTFRSGVPQVYLDIDREQAQAMGVPLEAIWNTLGAYMGGSYVNDFTYFGRIYQVKLQAEAAHRAWPEDIVKLRVADRAGHMVPLGTLLDVQEIIGPQTITHFNIYPAARINGSAAPGFSSGQAMAVVEDMAARKLPTSMGFEWTELSYQEKMASGSTAVTFIFSIVLVYLVLAAQYESWSIPISIVLGVPTALLGAVAGLMIRGFDNNLYAQIGIVLLIGLAAKTAILIVEFAKVRHEKGVPVAEAAVDACRLRFRAVLMTAFSFILGVIPLLVASGAGAASRQILGMTVFAGMLIATVVGMAAVPMLYYIIQSLVEKSRSVDPARARATG